MGTIVLISGSNVGIANEGAGKSSVKNFLTFPLVILVNSMGYEVQEFNAEGEKSEISSDLNQKK